MQPKRWSEDEISDHTRAAVDGLFDGLFDLRQADGPDGPEPAMVDMAHACEGLLAGPPELDLLDGISAHDLD